MVSTNVSKKMALTEATMFRSPELKPFLLEGVKRTGKQLGVGSYGAVEELRVGGAVCAGKKLHEALLDPRDEGVKCMLERFASECQLMANLRHPHVVQFLGLCFLPGVTVPFLMMERMDTSLDKVCDLTLCPLFSFSRSLAALGDNAPLIASSTSRPHACDTLGLGEMDLNKGPSRHHFSC